MRDRPEDVFGSTFEQVGEAHMNLPFTQSDGGIQTGKAAKADVERRHWRARPQISILFFKDGVQ